MPRNSDGRDRSPLRLPPDDVSQGRYRRGHAYAPGDADSGFHENQGVLGHAQWYDRPDPGPPGADGVEHTRPTAAKRTASGKTKYNVNSMRQRLIAGEFNKDIDMTDAANDNNEGPSGANDSQTPRERTMQSFDIKPTTKIERYTCESSYHVRSKIDGGFATSGCDVIPWESMRQCHNDAQWSGNLEHAIGWRPIGCTVEIFNMRAHADISINTASFFPVNLDQVRVRYLPHSLPLAPRAAVFDSVSQYNTWRTLLATQSTGQFDKDLPNTSVYIGQDVDKGRGIDYDEIFWSERKVHDDKMLTFTWNGSGPWRNCNELYIPTEIKLPCSYDNTAANRFATYLAESRFDYRQGIIEAPFSDYRRMRLLDLSTVENATHNKPLRICLKHSYVTKDLLNNFNALTKSITDTRDTALDLNTYVERKKYLGDSVSLMSGNLNHDPAKNIQTQQTIDDFFYEMPDIPYYDDNYMKPVILAFSRFMKNDNIQEYRVYYEMRIKHHYEVLKSTIPSRQNLKSDNSIWPNSQGIGNANKLVPFSLWTTETAEDDRANVSFDQRPLRMRYFRPQIDLIPITGSPT